MTIKKHIPNLLTLGNLLCGTIATIAAVNEAYVAAAVLVVLGIIFDFFDGFAARILKVSGELGKQLDSLADMVTRYETSRLLVEQAANAYDSGQRCDLEAGMAKYSASEAAIENSLEAMRIHGGYGYSKEFVIERLYRDAPLMAIGEGTNEMQKIIIARQLIERNKI